MCEVRRYYQETTTKTSPERTNSWIMYITLYIVAVDMWLNSPKTTCFNIKSRCITAKYSRYHIVRLHLRSRNGLVFCGHKSNLCYIVVVDLLLYITSEQDYRGFSLQCLGPWMNHVPPVWWYNLSFMPLIESWCVSLTSWRVIFYWCLVFIIVFIHCQMLLVLFLSYDFTLN